MRGIIYTRSLSSLSSWHYYVLALIIKPFFIIFYIWRHWISAYSAFLNNRWTSRPHTVFCKKKIATWHLKYMIFAARHLKKLIRLVDTLETDNLLRDTVVIILLFSEQIEREIALKRRVFAPLLLSVSPEVDQQFSTSPSRLCMRNFSCAAVNRWFSNHRNLNNFSIKFLC